MKALGQKMSDNIHRTVSRYRERSDYLADDIDDSLRLLPVSLFPSSHSLKRRYSAFVPSHTADLSVCRLVSRDLGVWS